MADTSGGLTVTLCRGELSLFCFTQKWQQKNQQFHALLRTVIHGIAQSHTFLPIHRLLCISIPYCNKSFLGDTIQPSSFKEVSNMSDKRARHRIGPRGAGSVNSAGRLCESYVSVLYNTNENSLWFSCEHL